MKYDKAPLNDRLAPGLGWTGVWTGLPQGVQLRGGRLLVCANHGFGGGASPGRGSHSDAA